MQVYSVLDVLTARPGAEELRACAASPLRPCPSRHQPIRPARGMRDVICACRQRHACGCAPDLRRRHRALFPRAGGRHFGNAGHPGIGARALALRAGRQGRDKLHRILMREDPEAAMTLRAGDGQRIVRALEVLEASGRSILKWQAERGQAADRPRTAPASRHRARPGRTRRAASTARFDRMIEAGALDEVKALTALDLDPELPAMKAIGVRELQAALRRRDFRWPRRSHAPRSRRGNMPSARRPGSGTSSARIGGASAIRTSAEILRFATLSGAACRRTEAACSAPLRSCRRLTLRKARRGISEWVSSAGSICASTSQKPRSLSSSRSSLRPA